MHPSEPNLPVALDHATGSRTLRHRSSGTFLERLLQRFSRRRHRASRLNRPYRSVADRFQSVMDIIGVFEPTPLADIINSAVSAVRASRAATESDRSEHRRNAIISGIGVLPLAGDLAKLFRRPYGAPEQDTDSRGRKIVDAISAATSQRAERFTVWQAERGRLATQKRGMSKPSVDDPPPDKPFFGPIAALRRKTSWLFNQRNDPRSAAKVVRRSMRNDPDGDTELAAVAPGERIIPAASPGDSSPPVGPRERNVAGILKYNKGGTVNDSESSVDKLQTAMDVAGTIDPTPLVDFANATISLGRAAMTSNPQERGYHMKNALISGVSGAIPYIGDLAKVAKYGGKTAKAAKATNASQHASRGYRTSSLADLLNTAPTPPPAPSRAASWTSTPPNMAKLDQVAPPPAPTPPPPTAARWAEPSLASVGAKPRNVADEIDRTVNRDTSTGRRDDTQAGGGVAGPPNPPNRRATAMGDWNWREFIEGGAAGAAVNLMAMPMGFGRNQGNAFGPRGLLGTQAVSGEFALPGRSIGDLAFAAPGSQLRAGLGYAINPARGGGAVGRDLLQGIGQAAGPAAQPMVSDLNRMLQRQVESLDLKNLLKDPLGPLKVFATNLKEAALNLDGWASNLKESQRHLAKYNGELAASFVRSEFRDIRRDIGSAGRRAGSTAELTSALDDLRDMTRPYQDQAINILNSLLTNFVKATTLAGRAVELLTPIDEISALINKIFEDKSKDFPVNDFLRELHDRDLYDHRARKLRRPPPP